MLIEIRFTLNFATWNLELKIIFLNAFEIVLNIFKIVKFRSNPISNAV